MDTLDTRRSLAALALALLLLGPATATATPSRPATDPFLVLVERPTPPEPDEVERVEEDPVVRPPPPPPLVVEVLGFVQESATGEALAVIEYRGGEYVVGDGWSGDPDDTRFDGRFRVVEVGADELVVYDSRTRARKTLR